MVLILLTRLLLTLYGLGLLGIFIRVLGLMLTGKTFSMGDLGTIVAFPLMLTNLAGRTRLVKILESGE